VQHQGRWHLAALEAGTGIRKTFLLRRIVGAVATTGKTFDPPEGNQSTLALDELEQVWNSHTAVVEVVPGSDAATRLHKRRGTTVTTGGALELHFSDVNIFADELAGFGPEVLVLSPPELRGAVRTRLARTAADHG
jgi:proteasome accessory factor B